MHTEAAETAETCPFCTPERECAGCENDRHAAQETAERYELGEGL